MSQRTLELGFSGHSEERRVEVPPDAPPPWDLRSDLKVAGKPHPRLEARLKVTGAARYTADQRLPGMIFAGAVRSPHAHARVRRLDLSRAKKLPGVLYSEAYPQREVRYAGQAVAALAAESEQVLDDALALVEVDYEVLPHVVRTEDALAEDAPAVAGRRNVRQGRGMRRGSLRRVEEAHARADVVLTREYRTQVQTHTCLEPHGSVARWEGDRLTVWASTQATFAFRQTLARALGISAAQVEVITEHMGGGFGSKFGADAWDVFAARAARATGRPCFFMLDRRAEHLVAGNRPDSIQRCTFSVRRDGKLLGAQVTSHGTAGLGRGAGVLNPAIYAFEATYSDQYDVLTHAGSARAFRAPRHPQGVFALEGMLDELAEAIGMDPLELRRKNDPHPVRQAQYDVGAEAIGWSRRKPSGSSPGPLKRGLGVAAARWAHNARPGTAVRCRIGRDGSVLVANGSQDIGTGTRTILAQIVAEELGLPLAAVEVRLGRTRDPYGHGSGGSVTAPSIAPPARRAAYACRQRLLAAVAAALGCEAESLSLREGRVHGAERELSFAAACGLLPTESIEATATGGPEDMSYPSFTREVAGVQFAEVEVDAELGTVRVVKVVAVQDCGLVANPLLARSQINGGVLQGISYALHEERILDARTGDMLNANLLDYKILGAREVPEIVAIPFSVANGRTSTGMSSLGEPPTVPTAGAVANAVANAIGARVRSLPITPEKVLAAIAEAERTRRASDGEKKKKKKKRIF
ncbi:MAG: xanthine dehydrogenase family protein molybdopterin-binding subunit [Planctomycetota bacterium]|nr:MAG: xanthine dehydrogenase family protein molybdopterin-binding subunit [Planctomycetota bacterium]